MRLAYRWVNENTIFNYYTSCPWSEWFFQISTIYKSTMIPKRPDISKLSQITTRSGYSKSPPLWNRLARILLHIPGLRLNLQQLPILTLPTPNLRRINALGVSSVLLPAALTAPTILVINHIRVFSGDLHFLSIGRMRRQGVHAFRRPVFKAGSVRLVADVGDHEVCQVAVFVRQGVEEAVFGVDDLFC